MIELQFSEEVNEEKVLSEDEEIASAHVNGTPPVLSTASVFHGTVISSLSPCEFSDSRC